MKNLLIYLCLIGIFAVNCLYAQNTANDVSQGQGSRNELPAPPWRDKNDQIPEQQRRTPVEQKTNDALIKSGDGGFLKPIGNNSIDVGLQAKAIQYINSVYRKTNKEELKLLMPSEQDLARFASFLRQENTGITKLVPNKGCANNTNIVVATADCLPYTMPGGGNSYSFRIKDYVIQSLADMTFYQNSFLATGVKLNGIFVSVGDIPLEQINLQTNGIGFLVNFKPKADYLKAKEMDEQLNTGIKADGFLYSRTVTAKDNTTYILRSVAYRGYNYKAEFGFTYNEFDFDKRNDVIVAFRVVRRYDDGAVLILWKRLAKQSSPKMK